MRAIYRRHRYSFSILVVALSLLMSIVTTPSASAGGLILNPDKGRPGTEGFVTGSGFAPNEVVDILFGGIWVGGSNQPPEPYFDHFFVPNVSPGVYPVEVIGRSSGNYLSALFTVFFYEMPFPCGSAWTVRTSHNHKPGILATDWNLPPRGDAGGDIDLGEPVYAGTVGEVIFAGWADDGTNYGNRVIISQGGGYNSTYSHLDTILVNVGQHVTPLVQVGTVGKTGLKPKSSDPKDKVSAHLHYEQRYNGTLLPVTFGGTKIEVPVSPDLPESPDC